MDIRAGEIIGIAGVEGNGQMQLEEQILGFMKCTEGSITMLGNDVTRWNTRKRCGLGIGYIPSDRQHRAVLPGFSIEENYLLGNQFSPEYVKNGIIQQEYLYGQTLELMKKYDVRTVDKNQAIGSLSGGNQQKMMLSREGGR